MAQKGGTMKRVLLILIFLVLFVVVFILLGGGTWLKSAGIWIGDVGEKAEDAKQTLEQKATTIEKTIEQKATTIEKTVEKLKEGDTKGEKK